MKVISKNSLVDRIVRLSQAMRALYTGPHADEILTLMAPSRHAVLRGQKSGLMGKLYLDPLAMNYELGNLSFLSRINKERTAVLKNANISNDDYIGLPTIVQTPDHSGTDMRYISPIRLFSAAPGDSLYNKTLEGLATFEDYINAAVQVVRIQVEARSQVRYNSIKKQGETLESNYFVKRFTDSVDALMRYGKITMRDTFKQEMVSDWYSLVVQKLMRVPNFFTGYYFDGNPRHHIIDDGERKIVSIDFEYKHGGVPLLIGISNLLSFGVSPDKTADFEDGAITKIFDRILLEMEFIDSLQNNYFRKAKEIQDYIIRRREKNDNDLSGNDSDSFYKWMGSKMDIDAGKTHKQDFMHLWPYAKLQRAVEWAAHKTNYNRIYSSLIENKEQLQQEGVMLGFKDPIAQNLIEQKYHLDAIVGTLDYLRSTQKNGSGETARRLLNRFNEIGRIYS